MMTADRETAAYMPWTTFMNSLDLLTRHMPNRVDKSVFAGQSGGTQSQLINGFRFLGLISDDGKAQPSLLAIAVREPAARKAALKKVIEERYAPLFALDLTKTTPKEFSERMSESYLNTGDSARKAMRFFLSAIEYIGVGITPLLAKEKAPRPSGNGGATRKRRTKRVDEGGDEIDGDFDATPPAQAGESRSVTLKSGGTLTLSASTKFMALSSTDRKFVFDLIDTLEEYETQGDFQPK